MKKNFKILFVQLIVVALCIINLQLKAQESKVIDTKAGTMKLLGTSTFHNWCMNGIFQVAGKYKMAEGTHVVQALNELTFSLPVENLKSDKKKLDETAYKALKTDKYKEILFKMTSATVKVLESNKYFVTALGNLTIAGVTKPITLNVYWIVNADNSITCTGVQALKMTDYHVQPPSFLGFMKTGDDITLDFSFQIKS